MNINDILELDQDFKVLVDFVVASNTSGQFEYWSDVWAHVKTLNKSYKICGWDAKVTELRNHSAYENMCYELEKLSTLR